MEYDTLPMFEHRKLVADAIAPVAMVCAGVRLRIQQHATNGWATQVAARFAKEVETVCLTVFVLTGLPTHMHMQGL